MSNLLIKGTNYSLLLMSNKSKCFSVQLEILIFYCLCLNFYAIVIMLISSTILFYLRLSFWIILWSHTKTQSYMLPGTGQQVCSGGGGGFVNLF